MKYSKDGEFRDPVVRCDSCSRIILVESLKRLGMCECGNRKVRNLLICNEKEMTQMKDWDVDPDFMALFEGVKS